MLITNRNTKGLAIAFHAGCNMDAPLKIAREGEVLRVTPLNFAIGTSDPIPIVRQLLDLGANVNQTSVDDDYPIISATGLRDQTLVALLLEHKANPNVQSKILGITALMTVLSTESNFQKAVETATLLISKGADVNLRTTTNHTALMFAVKAKNFEAVKLLLNAGADPMARNSANETAMSLAQNLGFSEATHLLSRESK